MSCPLSLSSLSFLSLITLSIPYISLFRDFKKLISIPYSRGSRARSEVSLGLLRLRETGLMGKVLERSWMPEIMVNRQEMVYSAAAFVQGWMDMGIL